ncbi:hypothetical protein FS837_001092 [Tulasnella sp. UAMH 9824]|nr:hypothetical protein FS837_001092 [Tulasnella sp. UAMH 9824]
MDLQYLSPKIRTILTAPDVDLATISAKRVRKQLAAGGESEDFLKQRKADVDALIAQIYESVSSGAGAGSGQQANGSGGKPRPGTDSAYAAASPQKRKRSISPANDAVPPSSQPQPLVHKKSKQLNGGSAPTKQLSADAELARQLSLELNGRSTRGGGSSSGGSKPKASKANGKKAKRSKATIDSDGDDDQGDDGKPKKARGGLGKEYILSEPLANLTGHASLSRPQAVKKLWEHIKANELQNPDDKREILCDPPMKAVFHADKINMFKMNKLLGQHLFEPGEVGGQ